MIIILPRLRRLSICLFGLMLPMGATLSAETAERPLRLIELFTSQGCSSCPPADRLLGELLQQDDTLMALEFHVDYWDSLQHGSDGSWRDPFSDAAFTERQQRYHAARLAGRRGVYTPQAVINGSVVAVGSDEKRLRHALDQAQAPTLSVSLSPSDAVAGEEGEWLQLRVAGSEQALSEHEGAHVSLLRYLDETQTRIEGGENNRRELRNHHVVVGMQSLGRVSAGQEVLARLQAPVDGQGCVVIVQAEQLGPIAGAAECP